MKVGRRLAMKVLNASKFVLVAASAPPRSDAGRGHRAGRPRDARRGCARSSAGPPRRSRPTTTRPRSRSTEKFFWEFCDDYLELVKERAYGARGDDAAASAKAALAIALHVQLRLLAPFLPYVTEEVWSWWQDGSIHRASLADRRRDSVPRAAGDPAMLAAVAGGAARHPRREVAGQGVDAHRAVPCHGPGPAADVALARQAAEDLKAAGKVVGELAFEPGDGPEVTVDAEIAPQPA